MRKDLFVRNCLTAIAAVVFATFAASHAVAENVVRIATPYGVTTLDPIKTVAAGNIEVLGQLYSRLLRTSPDGKQLLPGLAESWESSEDGLTHTFHLRDAKFSDGSPITAEDVVFSFTRLRDQEDSAYSGAFQVIKTIEALDDKTVRFTLKGPAGPFIGSVEMFNAGIVPKRVVEELGDEEFALNPVVSGPFKVKKWEKGDRLTLERNPHYWREGLPYIDGVDIVQVGSDQTRVAMLQAGEVDVVVDVPWTGIDELRAAEGTYVPLNPSSVIYMVLLNHKAEPFNDVRVRKAFAHAIDVASIVRVVTMGHAVQANSPLPSALDYYNPDLPAIRHDPEKAKALLAEAGKSGMEFELMVPAGNAPTDQMAVLMQAQLAAVGIKANIVRVAGGLWWDKVTNANYNAAPSWWYNETVDPDQAVRWALCGTCGNSSFYTYYNNDKVNGLIEQATLETDQDARRALYHEIQQIAQDEVSQIPLFYQPFRIAYSTRVEGLRMSPALQWSLDQAKVHD